jgi:hypothetical protein
MGTHIDCFFPHTVERSPEAVRERLAAVFGGLKCEADLLRARGRFSAGGGDWWLVVEGVGVTGEGPCGFSVSVHRAVAVFTSLERFGAVERPDQGTHGALRRVFEAVAAAFGAGGRLAVAAGGFGATDRANDVAASGAGFAEVCGCLEADICEPARSWEALERGEGGWYLSVPPEPSAATGTS